MARSDRTGNRKRREDFKTRIPDLGYYTIVTDAKQTEENYLEGLRKSLPNGVQDRIVIKVSHARTEKLIDVCIQQATRHPQYSEPWIVFDRDRVPSFDKIIEKATHHHIHVGWSNPCIETWFFAYYGPMPPYSESTACCERFSELFNRKTGHEYSKSDPDIYEILQKSGDEEKALKTAESRYQMWNSSNMRPSKMCPCTTLHHLVGEVWAKTQKTK